MTKNACLGLLVGNRAFFPDELAREGYAGMTQRLEDLGCDLVVLRPEESKFGCVETWEEAKRCGALFKANADRLDGVLVTLPNFGDERAVADTLKLSGLDVPVLVHAWPDDPAKMSLEFRRDSFCGKMSVCNNLAQYGIPYSLTRLHTMDPVSEAFASEVQWFAAVCRIVKGLRTCRVGALGARPAPFNTVRYSEKLLQESGITVETMDLSEALGRIDGMADDDAKVVQRIQQFVDYVPTQGVPKQALTRMAKLAL
ncbi:MAG TPA: fucose isomerase, partial [Candidatus Hydrogenedentes bacterium]|nr:fucose isomerase [Candidatus Hydrogenedentota bacterium]